ncbi:terminase small subunit [Pseudomonas solani]|uniref:terminase small subunit n=1 Tax=Pseudomonas solani TaxID=2731552 RepID=UPI0035BE4F25
MEYITKSEYAARIGVSKAYISKLAKQDRLVLDEAGRVDVEATDALLAETADPSKAGVAERHQRDRADKGVHAHVTPSSSATLPAPPTFGQPDFQKARARREHYLAGLAEDEFRKGRGELVERETVDREGFDIARTVRDLLLGLPAKVSGELVAITDAWEMEQRLTALIRSALEEAAGEVTARSAANDEAEEAA